MPRYMTDAQRDAAREFMRGFWSDPARRSAVSRAMSKVWSDYKRTGLYERLRQELSDAYRNGNNS